MDRQQLATTKGAEPQPARDCDRWRRNSSKLFVMGDAIRDNSARWRIEIETIGQRSVGGMNNIGAIVAHSVVKSCKALKTMVVAWKGVALGSHGAESAG